MKSKRIQWLDFARGVAIFFVVMAHSLANTPDNNSLMIKLSIPITRTLALVSMPVFFIISGYLFKPTNTGHKFILMCYKKLTSFVIPYIVFTIISIAVDLNGNYNPTHYILLPLDYLWFLYTLLFIFIIFGLMDLFNIKYYYQLLISIITLIVSLNMPSYLYIKDIVNPIKSVLQFMILFYIGVLMRKYNLPRLIRSKYLYILTLIWIILLITHFIIFKANDTTFIHLSDMITKLLGIPVFFELFARFPHNFIFKYFDKYGKASLVIYMFQSPFTSVIGKSMTYIIKYYNIYLTFLTYPLLLIILATISWYLCTLCCYLTHFKVINYIFYPRKLFNNLLLKTSHGKQFLTK